MKRLLVLIFMSSFLFTQIYAQQVLERTASQVMVISELNPIYWDYSYKKINNGEVELIIKAQIAGSWNLYGQYFDEGGPIPLKISFEKKSDYELKGKTKELQKPKTKIDDVFGINVTYFTRYATFVQKIALKNPSQPINIRMTIEGQACHDNDGKCVMVQAENLFNIK